VKFEKTYVLYLVNKAVIFIADSDPNGQGHKLILPAIRFVYIKKGIECKVIDPYRQGYDPTSTSNMEKNIMARSYKHDLKTADHVHFITSSHLGGISPMMEAIFEQVLVNGFAYDRPENVRKKKLKKKAFFYVMYNHKVCKLNPLWFRLRWIVLRQLFGIGKVFQYNPNEVIKKHSKSVSEKIRVELNKHLF
jgi:hypothetical protein